MEAVPATIGSSNVLFEAVDVAAPSEAGDVYGTSQTATRAKELMDVYQQLKGVLQDVADDLGQAMANRGPHRPSSVELTFGLAFSAEANAWVFKAGGDVSVSATLKWSET